MVISIVVCHQWLYSAIISDQAVQLRGWAGTLEITPPMADIHHNNLKQSIQMFSWHQRDTSIFTSHFTTKEALLVMFDCDFWAFYAHFHPEINDLPLNFLGEIEH